MQERPPWLHVVVLVALLVLTAASVGVALLMLHTPDRHPARPPATAPATAPAPEADARVPDLWPTAPGRA
ncbi:MAG: hypothetical protein GX591_12380 [Planctomycetes bacterium]|nr:hypothetical protein [Planctomycetota bacterium]